MRGHVGEKSDGPTFLYLNSECSISKVVALSEWQTSQRRSVVKTTSSVFVLDSSATAGSRWPQPVAELVTSSRIPLCRSVCARVCVGLFIFMLVEDH